MKQMLTILYKSALMILWYWRFRAEMHEHVVFFQEVEAENFASKKTPSATPWTNFISLMSIADWHYITLTYKNKEENACFASLCRHFRILTQTSTKLGNILAHGWWDGPSSHLHRVMCLFPHLEGRHFSKTATEEMWRVTCWLQSRWGFWWLSVEDRGGERCPVYSDILTTFCHSLCTSSHGKPCLSQFCNAWISAVCLFLVSVCECVSVLVCVCVLSTIHQSGTRAVSVGSSSAAAVLH